MNKIYVIYLDGYFKICEKKDADFSVYSKDYDNDRIIEKINHMDWKGPADNKDDDCELYLGFKQGTNGYDYFLSCKKSQKIRYLIDKTK